MASLVYLRGISNLLASFAGKDIRAALVMTNTTADTENTSITFMSNFTTLDECNATGYARVALTSEAVNVDTGNVRVELDAADITFSGLGGDASRPSQGVVLYEHVTNDADSKPIVFIEFTATRPATATSVTVPWNAEGIIQAEAV